VWNLSTKYLVACAHALVARVLGGHSWIVEDFAKFEP
jgi:hypothetical protein